jgi:hypothetical protein
VAAHHAHAIGRNVDVPGLGRGVMSEGGNYFIPDSYDGDFIYVAGPPPRASVQIDPSRLPPVVHNGRTYRPYASASQARSNKFVRDCLHTAEEIMADAELAQGDVYSKVAGTLDDFGDTDDNNKAAAQAHWRDGNAAPVLGQAYVIVNTLWPGGDPSPYHAAGVVAQDRGDRVTLEVFATQSDGRRTVQYATYRIYPTGSADPNNFHRYWTREYFHGTVRTIVVEPK